MSFQLPITCREKDLLTSFNLIWLNLIKASESVLTQIINNNYSTRVEYHPCHKYGKKHFIKDTHKYLLFLPSFLATIINTFLFTCGYHDESECAAKVQPIVLSQQTIPNIIESKDLMHQSDSMNLDDTQGDTTSHTTILQTPPATSLSKSQKKITKKKLKKAQQVQQQTLEKEDNPFITSSSQSPENVLFGTIGSTSQSSFTILHKLKDKSDNSPPAKNNNSQEKKWKSEYVADKTNHSLIITGYSSLGEEQTQLLNLIVYNIPTK
ncbi:hypothetical protein RclHR1_06840003 [Rhizophagus clarus]|uniref:Uncharacterized protein n=1 Tax=Rhizophagus clarus TaxID=94130 RepID=A0A2Z6SJZ1_9GLOM|nr:hypothetical protein RclHR1_06840003 [Rhizophagus clarus]